MTFLTDYTVGFRMGHIDIRESVIPHSLGHNIVILERGNLWAPGGSLLAEGLKSERGARGRSVEAVNRCRGVPTHWAGPVLRAL